MIDFSSGYSYAEILQQMLGQVDDRLDKREGSLIQTALGPGAWYLEGLALALQQIQGEAFVDSATGEPGPHQDRGDLRGPAGHL